MNPCRTSFPDLREAGETSHKEEKWDGTEGRGRGVCLGQTDEISRGCRQNSAWDNFPTLNNKKGLPRNHGGSVWTPGRSTSEGAVYMDLHLGLVFSRK